MAKKQREPWCWMQEENKLHWRKQVENLSCEIKGKMIVEECLHIEDNLGECSTSVKHTHTHVPPRYNVKKL